jgi:methylmalonyl-CoA/ethylmalonyl-CoA epimerase
MNEMAAAWFGDATAFHHVGLAVRSIAEAAGSSAAVVRDDTQRVSVAFVDVGGVRVELIEPAGESSPVALSLEKGQQLVHLCFEVADIDRALEAGRARGFYRLGRPVPAAAFDNRRIVWVFSRTFGLVELLERQPC